MRVAFKMILKKGCTAEYLNRHKHVWPEILELLKHNGVEVYSLFLDRESETVYAFQKIKKDINSQGLRHHEIIQKWWFYMSDIMECNLDHSPVSIKLDEIFYLE